MEKQSNQLIQELEITKLTQDSLKHLITNYDFQNPQNLAYPQKQLVFQVIGLQQNCQGQYKCLLSDGFSKINCVLTNRAKILAKQNKLNNFALIIVKQNQLKLKVPHQLKDITSQINDCQIIKTTKKLIRPIGQPIIYNQYENNGFQNQKGSTDITKGFKHYTINQIVGGGYKWGSLKAKILSLPKSIPKGFLNIRVIDDQSSQINLVCFDSVAQNVFRQAKINKYFIIKDFILQINKKTSQPELKLIKNQSLTSPQEQDEVQTSNSKQKSEEFKKVKSSTKHQNQNSQCQTYQISQLINLLPLYKEQSFDFHIVAFVIQIVQKGSRRILKVKDKFNKQIQLVLWQQIKDKVEIFNNYLFKFLRISFKLQNPQLQSTRLTEVQKISQEEEKYNNSQSLKLKLVNNFDQMNVECQNNLKPVPNNIKILTIEELINYNPQNLQKQNTVKNYAFCLCYIEVLKMRSFEYKYDEWFHFFQISCQLCKNKKQSELRKNPTGLICSSCNKSKLTIRWNIKTKAVDNFHQIPCSIQDQITSKFFEYQAKDAYQMYDKNRQEFHKLMLKLHYVYRICKFMIKTSTFNKQIKRYYNIIQIYKQGPTQNIIQQNLKKIAQNQEKIKLLQQRNQNKISVFEKEEDNDKFEKEDNNVFEKEDNNVFEKEQFQ